MPASDFALYTYDRKTSDNNNGGNVLVTENTMENTNTIDMENTLNNILNEAMDDSN